MHNLTEFDHAYLSLTLEINKHIDGYIDAYIGPDHLKNEIENAEDKSIDALQEDLAWLQNHIPTVDPERHAYLTAVLRAIDCTLRMEADEKFEYLDEVQRLYDISPHLRDEESFAEARRTLEDILPGEGDLHDKLEARQKRYELSSDKLLPLLELVCDECRQRTRSFVDLVDNEDIQMMLVNDQPWSAYNWYKGNGKSLIEFNTDIPVSLLRLPELMAHEVYPGHHTEGQIKEHYLYKEKGYGEQAAMLLHSPSAVIAEGIATTAVEIIFPEGSHYDYIMDVLLPESGIDPQGDSADSLRRISAASSTLKYVNGNAAILYHNGELDKEQAIEYIQTYRLTSRQRAEQMFRFVASPLFRSYIFTYTYGYDLIEKAASEDNKKPIFLKLLHKQILPSSLEAN